MKYIFVRPASTRIILWTSGGGPVVGWLDTKAFDEAADAATLQGVRL
jgi:hypothetical protein